MATWGEATGEAFDDDAASEGVAAAGGAVDGVPRLWRYATKAPKSVPVALTGGIPPACILSVGCCRTLASAAGVIVLLRVVNAGALLVPTPPAP